MKDCQSKIKDMTINSSLPKSNSLEDLLLIRVALDWEDIYKNKAA